MTLYRRGEYLLSLNKLFAHLEAETGASIAAISFTESELHARTEGGKGFSIARRFEPIQGTGLQLSALIGEPVWDVQ